MVRPDVSWMMQSANGEPASEDFKPPRGPS
jgi:hypothetical protein